MVPSPRFGRKRARGEGTIRGEMPSALAPPPGCVFHPRCPKAAEICRVTAPVLEPAPALADGGRDGQLAACHFKA
jgi:oligopeptide/dipeptide ABC transporter ATP-binding protein